MKLVDPVCHIFRRRAVAQDQVTGKPLLDQLGSARQMLFSENGLSMKFPVIQHPGFIQLGLVVGKTIRVFSHTPVRDEKLGDLFLGSQSLYIRLSPLPCRNTPVVKILKLPASVQIFKVKSVPLYHVS